ncbi:MBL fold metallo-hydrolase [Streptomyces sp. SL13]|uniref:MBL fold metallo-hydrolase n=1 Tax=Streptantibioticus silvisoli TaxID=2705255 RepID=A0AA90GYP0_9ACTN|nr:MBL fold metallo-hydrolase [Streptantibioticus silvisoli]MDI5961428.1 MBL fold metallo-hydrolase [Streptantibioticus silvisoli]MDI5968011.1 MBL fold metallo-hydrolase [Streptantibioticus silvisoli]
MGNHQESAERDGWEHLAPGVARRRLPFLDVTVGAVAGAGRLLVVDSGSTLGEGAAIAAGLRDLTGLRVTDVVLTHGHFDHVLGTAAFGGSPRVYAAAGLAELLAREHDRDALRADAVRHGVDPAGAARAVAALAVPDEPVDGRRELDLGGRAVTLLTAGPGHTGHDLAVLVPGSPPVVFCGDLVEESGDPQAGPDAVPAAWPAALDRLLALGGERARYVPGHGAVVDAGFVRAQRDALAARAARA